MLLFLYIKMDDAKKIPNSFETHFCKTELYFPITYILEVLWSVFK